MTSKAAKRKARQRALMMVAAREAGRAPIKLCAAPWDLGASGIANQRGLVREERGEVDSKTGKVQNPNGVVGVRRVDLLEFWHRRGNISTDGFTAAEALRNAFEATMRQASKPLVQDRVDSSPKPDHAIDIQIERISRFQALMRFVADGDREIITACVLDGHHPARIYGHQGVRRGFEHLRSALDSVADRMQCRRA